MVLEQFEPHLSECSIGHLISFFISIFFSGKITPFYRQVFPYFDSDFFHVVDCHIGDILIV